MAAAADPADARSRDQPRLRVLALEDDLEAAEHRRFGPCVADHAVGDLHLTSRSPSTWPSGLTFSSIVVIGFSHAQTTNMSL